MTDNNSVSHPLSKVNKLVLSGGGLRGCAHIGVLKYLEENHLIEQFTCFAGTSIGSLVATLIVMTYTSTELTQIIKTFDYALFQSIDLSNLLINYGIDTFERIINFVSSLFIKKNFSPLITFDDLYHKTHRHLIINAVCLNQHKEVFFDYLSSPEMPVMVAIRASMSIPFIFGSVNYKGLTYVDGGLIDNFPINYSLFGDDSETVLGINLKNQINHSVRTIDSIESYIINIYNTLYNAYDNLHYDQSVNLRHNIHVVTIPTSKYSTFDFRMSNDDKQYLIDLGYQKIQEYVILHNQMDVKTSVNNQDVSTQTEYPDRNDQSIQTDAL